MASVRRITDPKAGPPDGVEADIKCAFTTFTRNEDPNKREIQSQTVMPCRVLCAYSEQTISLSIRDLDIMFTIRLDELFQIFEQAAAASILRHKEGS